MLFMEYMNCLNLEELIKHKISMKEEDDLPYFDENVIWRTLI